MVPFYFVAGLFSAYSLPLSATADPPSPEPLIFYNLTKDEFHAKLLDYRGSSLKRAASDAAEDHSHISKRVPVRGEMRNNAEQQAVMEQRAKSCEDTFDVGYRPLRGFCEDDDTAMFWYCDYMEETLAFLKALRKRCKSSEKHPAKCATLSLYNYRGNTVELPYCAEIIKVDKKEEELEFTPVYEGYKTLPYEVWSPGTWDSFYELAGHFSGLTGNYEYRGHHASGQSFISQSPKQARSWACLGCPSGTLYVKTVGFKAEAWGFSLPAGSWT